MLTPQTGNEKGDEVLRRIVGYVDMFDNFTIFYDYFTSHLKTDDMRIVNRYLLMGLFTYLKQPKQKHPFDEMIEILEKKEPEKAKNLKQWLENSLYETKATYGGERK